MNAQIYMVPSQFSVEEASKFRDITYSQLAEGIKLFEIDFSQCAFIDSTGLGVLVGLYKRCQEVGAQIVLKHLNKDVERVFKMTRLDHVFTIH